MKYIKNSYWCRKNLVGVFALGVMLLLVAGSSFAATYTAINMYPRNVGVFTTDGKQQFVAYGQTATGWTNITTNVGWESSDESIVTIDDNGLATIVAGKTFGQVKISCSYPKQSQSQTGPNLLLLNNGR